MKMKMLGLGMTLLTMLTVLTAGGQEPVLPVTIEATDADLMMAAQVTQAIDQELAALTARVVRLQAARTALLTHGQAFEARREEALAKIRAMEAVRDEMTSATQAAIALLGTPGGGPVE
jgi:hypothetical protein